MTAAAGAPDDTRRAAGSHGRHRSAPPPRARRRWPFVALAVAVLMAVVAGIGLVVVRDDAGATVAGCEGTATLRIAAAPALTSTLKAFSTGFDSWVQGRAGLPCTTT